MDLLAAPKATTFVLAPASAYFLLYGLFSRLFLLITVTSGQNYAESATVTASFAPHLQPLGGDECARQCEEHEPSLVCYFRFEIELYYTMSKACYNCPYNQTDCFRPDCVPADGVSRVITVINRKLPGPSIQVCLGDSLVVDVVNSMVEESTSIHWHGHHQKYTPYMDGVPFITQCPIASGTTFRYLVTASHVGTHFWHSHTGTQRADGAFGAMIIRQPVSQETHAALYDYDLQEHVIQLIDWLHESSAAKFQSHYHSNGTNKPDTLLVNGKGQFRAFPFEKQIFYTPLAKFDVQQGKRYRFRVINAGFLYCPIQISIDNHTMTIISADGSDIKPVYAESLTIYAGERWDFVLNATNDVANYWMKFRGLKDCGEKYNKAYSLAILHYSGASLNDSSTSASSVKYEDTLLEGMHLNAVNVGAEEENFMTAAEMQAAVEPSASDQVLKPTADVSLIMSFDFYAVNNSMFHKSDMYGFNQVEKKLRTYTPQINHISMKMPSFPLLSQPESIGKNTFCNESTVQNCNTTFCSCVYKIDLPLHVVVELMLIDEAHTYDSNHPFHLHGHSFRVLSIDRLNNETTVEDVKAMDRAGRINRNLRDPPLKDTVTVPAGGFTILRFYTHNPGYWLLHCHLDFHVEVGMAVVLKVGEEKDFPSVPRNFPRCGDYYHQLNTPDQQTTRTTRNVSHVENSTTTNTSIIQRVWNTFAFNSANRASLPYIKVTNNMFISVPVQLILFVVMVAFVSA
ncbi:uncharacterized protein LOC135836952 [Planococcus citri]|uniref:uncharacterized protein LOC135836952 n=1 Tax=Planococcus citri TaxID=170843 RepID=UPI0031F9A360